MVGQILILRIRETMKWLSIMASKQTGPFHDLVVNYCCSVTQSCPTLCNLIDCSTPVFPVLPHLLKFAQTHVHWISDVIQPSHPVSPPSPPALNLSQHQGLFQWIGSSHQVAQVLELQLQHPVLPVNIGCKQWQKKGINEQVEKVGGSSPGDHDGQYC